MNLGKLPFYTMFLINNIATFYDNDKLKEFIDKTKYACKFTYDDIKINQEINFIELCRQYFRYRAKGNFIGNYAISDDYTEFSISEGINNNGIRVKGKSSRIFNNL